MTGSDLESAASTQSEPTVDAIKFILQDIVTDLPVTAIDPETATNYAVKTVSESHSIRGFNRKQFNESVTTSDAMTAGWIVHSPFAFRIEEVERNTYELHVPEQPDGSNVIQLTELGGDPVVIVNTLWDITTPNEYSTLVTTPLVTMGRPPETAPKEIASCESEDAAKPVTVILRVNDDFAVPKGGAVGQLIPIPETIPDAMFRVATNDEMSQIQKEERRRYIYPDTYQQNRDHNRSGEVRESE